MGSGRGLLIDLDGTLADSLVVMRAAYDRFLSNQGRVGSDEEFASLNGPPLTEVVSHLVAVHGLGGSSADLIDLYHELIDSEYSTVLPTPGSRELLREAKLRHWRTAVVSSGQSSSVSAWLHVSDLDGFIDVVVGGDSVDRGKPAPDPYLEGIRLLDVDPATSIAVEDSVQGAMSATAAGLRTFVFDPVGRWTGGEDVEPAGVLRNLLDLRDRGLLR